MNNPKIAIPTWINGITGAMGQILTNVIRATDDFELIGGSGLGVIKKQKDNSLIEVSEPLLPAFSSVDLVIDFSSIEGNQLLLEAAKESKPKSYIIATTGLPSTTIDQWDSLAKKGSKVLLAANTSLGVILTQIVSKQISKVLTNHFFDIEIAETHHRRKVDAPSGTALFLAEGIARQENLNVKYARTGKREANEIGVTSLRGGSAFGEHTVHFYGEEEEISITHRALSRELFAKGALVLSGWLLKADSGKLHRLENLDIDSLSY